MDRLIFPESSMDHNLALRALWQLQEGAGPLRSLDVWIRKLDGLVPGRELSKEQLKDLRAVLIEGARLATACAAIDETLYKSNTPPTPLKRGVVFIRSVFGKRNPDAIGDYEAIRRLPFEDLSPASLRVDLDINAQRLLPLDDGSPFVREGSEREMRAGELLKRADVFWSVAPRHGDLDCTISLHSRDDRRQLFSSSFTLEGVREVLQHGRAASSLLKDLFHQGVDLVRLCGLVDREASQGMRLCLEKISPQGNLRLEDIHSWERRFDSELLEELSSIERHELAMLLMDSELTLTAVEHLQKVVLGEERKKFWQGLWREAGQAKEVQCGINLAQSSCPPLQVDCSSAAAIASSGALALGFYLHDRPNNSWRACPNSVISLAWAIEQSQQL